LPRSFDIFFRLFYLFGVMRRAGLLLLLFSIPTLADPQPVSLIANVPGRTTFSLDGTWRIIVDPYETGLSARFYENRKPRDKRELVEYDFDASPTLSVPGDWNSQRPDMFFYEGPVWYKRSFSYRKREHVRTFVHFGGANYFSRVYLNGAALGEHEGGYTPFDFEISSSVRDGDNFLIVEVNNARRVDAVPSLNTDWWNFGGLTREVELVEVPDTFIRDYFIQLAQGSTSEVAGWVQLDGAKQSQRVAIEIPEAGLKQEVATEATGRGAFHFPARLDLWSPEHPKLYRVIFSGASDRIEEEIGFRSIQTQGTQILLNGQHLFLRGISMHEEAPFRGGRAFSLEDDETLLGWAQELGCNLARLAHYPHNERMARVADRLGLMLWEEVPVYWGNDWKNPKTLEVAEEQVRDLIDRDKNRASAILWSVANETPILPERLDFLKNLVAYARQQDSTRLFTAASDKTERPEPGVRLFKDPLGEILDVVGLNEYLGWYQGTPEDMDHTEWKIVYNKPLIISEFGAGAPFGNHGEADARWTEEYQVSVYKHQLQMLQKIPSLAGMTPWVLMDFHSPRRFLPGVQDYHNRKGLISDRGERKQAFYVLQSFYRGLSRGSAR
jgi:beta-glucuronidase